MNIKFGRRSFRFMNWTVRDLLCWQWFLILCKLPLFTFLPSSLMSNLYVWNSISRDCGSIRPIQPKTVNVPASMVCLVVKYRLGWLSAHCSYYYPRSRKACRWTKSGIGFRNQIPFLIRKPARSSSKTTFFGRLNGWLYTITCCKC